MHDEERLEERVIDTCFRKPAHIRHSATSCRKHTALRTLYRHDRTARNTCSSTDDRSDRRNDRSRSHLPTTPASNKTLYILRDAAVLLVFYVLLCPAQEALSDDAV